VSQNDSPGTPARTIGLDGKNYPARLTQEQRQERTERRVAIMVSTRGICHSWTAEKGLQNGGLQEVEQLVTKGKELLAEERQELVEVFDKYIALMSQFKETWGFCREEVSNARVPKSVEQAERKKRECKSPETN